MEPDTNSDQRRVIPAGEILAKIERGEPVEYDDVIVEGDLDLSGLDLPTEHVERTEFEIRIKLAGEAKVVKSPISIRNSEIRGTVKFGNAIFRESVDFTGTNFSDDAFFYGARFGGDAYFRWAKFSGDAYFSGAKFSGDANFSGAKFSNGACNVAVFYGAKFSGYANFANANFSDDANFSEAEFSGDVFFYGAKFSGDANFSKAEFSSGAYFHRAKFSGDADFREGQFSGDADFRRAEFSGDAVFGNVTFDKDAIFDDTLFHFSNDLRKYAGFSSVHFNGCALFRRAQFIKNASFSGSHFCGDTSFYGSQFSRYANFSGTKFVHDAITSFSEVRFRYDVDFRSSQFSSNTDFRKANFEGDAYFDSAIFDKKLYLSGLKFRRLYINWSSIKALLDCSDEKCIDGPTYLALVNNFKTIEQFDDAYDCYYQYRKESQDRNEWDSGNNWRKAFDIIAWISCGYGVRPIHTILCMLGVVVVGWIIYARLGYFDSPFESFYFSLMTFTGGVPDNLTPERWLKTVAMIEAILGYLFMALFVVVLARKLIR